MSAPFSIREEALRLQAATGWALFPTVKKEPAIAKRDGGRGLYDATKDPAELADLFRRAPHADGFAANCGASGLVVLDPDVKPGLDGRDSLRDAGLPWTKPRTIRATTPRGGEHAIFAGLLPTRTDVLPGVDIKSEKGYVVLPPAHGRAWQEDASPFDVAPAPAPDWLIRLARVPEDSGTPPAITSAEWDELLEDVREGRRHKTLIRLAGHLHRRYVDPVVVRVLVEAFNAARCRPPHEKKDIDRILSDVADRELRRRGGG